MAGRARKEVFGDMYAASYDALYQQKNYAGECDFIEACFGRFTHKPVRRVLDLGCGTGGHLVPLARRGYAVHGVDRSRHMLAVARRKARAAHIGNRVTLACGNIQRLKPGRLFDAAICMFAVVGYQTTNEALFSTLRSVRKALRPGGLFVCDFWYGPAVLADRPTERVKVCDTPRDRLIRVTTPRVDTETNTVDVTFQLMRLRRRRLVAETVETHPVRFLFRAELDFFLSQAGMELTHLCEFPFLDRTVSEKTWNVAAVARAI